MSFIYQRSDASTKIKHHDVIYDFPTKPNTKRKTSGLSLLQSFSKGQIQLLQLVLYKRTNLEPRVSGIQRRRVRVWRCLSPGLALSSGAHQDMMADASLFRVRQNMHISNRPAHFCTTLRERNSLHVSGWTVVIATSPTGPAPC